MVALICNPSPEVAKPVTVWLEANLGYKGLSEEPHSKTLPHGIKKKKKKEGAEFAARGSGLCVASDDRVSPLCRWYPAVFRAENDVRSH